MNEQVHAVVCRAVDFLANSLFVANPARLDRWLVAWLRVPLLSAPRSSSSSLSSSSSSSPEVSRSASLLRSQSASPPTVSRSLRTPSPSVSAMATAAALRSTTIGRRSLRAISLSRRTVDAAYEHSATSTSALSGGTASLSTEIAETLRTLAFANARFVFESLPEQRDAFRLYPFGDEPPYDALFIGDADLDDDELRAVRALASFAHVTERARLVSSAPELSSLSSSMSSSLRFELTDALNRRAATHIDTYTLVERTVVNVLQHCDDGWFALYATLFESAVASFADTYGDRAFRLIDTIRTFCR